MSIAGVQKKRGRPPTGSHPHITARLPPELVQRIDAWAKEKEVTRSEAIRQLVEQALSGEAP